MTRWTRRLLRGAIAVLRPGAGRLRGGLDAPTLEFHPATLRGEHRPSDGITIDNAFVLGPALDSALPAGGQAGVFLALSSTDTGDQLVSVSAPGTASSVHAASAGRSRLTAETRCA